MYVSPSNSNQQVGSQQMFMQQGNQMANRGGFNQAQNVLQGPLAYLEKTTSNIGKQFEIYFDLIFFFDN